MANITMKAVGYKPKKEPNEKAAQPVTIVDGDEPEMKYPIFSIDRKECEQIVDLEQDEMYEVRMLARVKRKGTGDKKEWDGGGEVTLEVQKLGFAPADKKKTPTEMDDDELDDSVKEAMK